MFGRRDLTKTVTIAAGQSAQTFTIAATSFQHFAQGATVEGGTLTAAVQAGTGYALGTHASVDVAIVVGLTVVFEMASYSVAEEAGTLEVKLVALTSAGALTPDTDATSSFYTVELDPLEAQIVHDYESVSATVTFAPSDFSAYGSVFKAEKTVSVTIVDNTMDEQDERFALLLDITPGLLREYQNFVDTDGASCQDTLLCPALVTITDTDIASADITDIEITSAPANVTYAVEGSAIRVTWEAVPGADYYEVYYHEFIDSACTLDRVGNPLPCEELAANVVGMSYLHENPSAVNNYYWVVACNSGGCSDIDSKNPAKPIETRPHAPAATPSSTGGAGELAQERAAELLAGELGVAVAGLKVVSTTAMTWSDASLGCPQPDMGYAQVVTPGYLVLFRDSEGTEYKVHTNEDCSSVIVCGK